MPATRSLALREHFLASSTRQLEILNQGESFSSVLKRAGMAPLVSGRLEVLQINVGKVCNQVCLHCHVDAGPDRRESMTWETMRACLDVVARGKVPVVDITGGAPEINPHFRELVREARALGATVIDRCNLTILLAPGFDDLPQFLADHKVEIIASLPCYSADNTDKQRGDGVFDRSIEAIRRLNQLGYGKEATGLILNLVYNPVGPSLPPDQATLEAAYRQKLRDGFGIEFNKLFTITNMPISRFLEDLLESGRFDAYLDKLVAAFNPAAVEGLMCRTTLSVGWDGRLFDCDFNQMLDLGLSSDSARHIRDFDPERFSGRTVTTARHCFGCAAGAGSSCQGTIA